MSRNQRIALIVVALVVAVVAFVIAQPGDDDEPEPSSATTPAETQTQTGSETEAETEAEPPPPPEPEVTRIQIKAGRVVGGVKTIEVAKGDVVRIVVTPTPRTRSTCTATTSSARPLRAAGALQFKADAEGAFELESHAAEDAGNEPVVARLLVGPS